MLNLVGQAPTSNTYCSSVELLYHTVTQQCVIYSGPDRGEILIHCLFTVYNDTLLVINYYDIEIHKK